MSSGHTHAAASEVTLRTTGRLRSALIGVVVLIALVTAALAVWLWPHGGLPPTVAAPGISQTSVAAQVVSVRRHTCSGTSDDRAADGTVPATIACAAVRVRLLDGPDAGHVVDVQVTGPTIDEGLAPGVRATVARFPDTYPGGDASADPSIRSGAVQSGEVSHAVYAWVDFDRDQPMWLLVAVFVLIVLTIARWRGLAALAGVVAGFAMILVFLLPTLRRGENPALVTLVGSTAVMLIVLYASHGVSAKTTSALLGTITALGLTAAIAVAAASAAHLTGQTGEDALSLTQLVGAKAISAAVISGLVLAGLGVLNDVTVTQASAVWELRAAAPHLTARPLFTRGMRIGRDHLASTVYTIAFAYAGLSLPTLILIQIYNRPLGETLTSAPIAQDIVGVLVAGIGLALAIPLTTAIAALIATHTIHNPTRARTAHRQPDHRDPAAATHTTPNPGAPAASPETFQEGLLIRRRRHTHPAPTDELDLDDTDWSSWPT